MRRFSSSLVSICGLLVVTRPSTATLPLGRKRSGSKPPARVAVVFEEIAVDLDLVEQQVGDRLVAAFRHPGAGEVAAAEMHADRHVGRSVPDRVVEQLARRSSAAWPGSSPILATCAAQLRIAQIGEIDLVDLQIAAAGARRSRRSPRGRAGRDRRRNRRCPDRRRCRSPRVRRGSASRSATGW